MKPHFQHDVMGLSGERCKCGAQASRSEFIIFDFEAAKTLQSDSTA